MHIGSALAVLSLELELSLVDSDGPAFWRGLSFPRDCATREVFEDVNAPVKPLGGLQGSRLLSPG